MSIAEFDRGIYRPWYTASEIAGLRIPGLPTTVKEVRAYAQANNWAKRTASDGTLLSRHTQFRFAQYHASLFPEAAQEFLYRPVLAGADRDVGKRLKQERKRLGLSLPFMAHLLHLPSSFYAPLENEGWREERESHRVLARLACLGVDVEFVVTGQRVKSLYQGINARKVLAEMDPADRRRLLLDLVAQEMGTGGAVA